MQTDIQASKLQDPWSFDSWTFDFTQLPGEPIAPSDGVRRVDTESGTALEIANSLRMISSRTTLVVRRAKGAKSATLSVRAVTRLVRGHSPELMPKAATLLILRVYDKRGKYLGPHFLTRQPQNEAWLHAEGHATFEQILASFPKAAKLRASVSANWVDAAERNNGGDTGITQILSLTLSET